MSAEVILQVVDGPAWTFAEPEICVIGRADDCYIVIPADEDQRVSRHHCLIDVNPPWVTVEDLGSRNGTFINNQDLRSAEEPVRANNGDIVRIGNTLIKVIASGTAQVERSLTCNQCGESVTIPPQESFQEGDFVCSSCREKSSEIIREMVRQALPAPETSSLHSLGDYDIVRELGRGGVGSVYLGTNRTDGAQAAIKTMLPSVAVEENARDKFLRETEIMRRLSHPNIVQMLDSGYVNGIFFLVMEYCDSGNLEEFIDKQGQGMSPRDAVALTIRILEGLEYAHGLNIAGAELPSAAGIVHRDIKPENIMLQSTDSGWAVKIADFGLAKAFNSSGLGSYTQTGTVGGTLAFVCRQQIVNYKYVKPEVDVWSTAAVLYYVLTGAPPRDMTKSKNPFTMVLENQPIPVGERRSDLPKALCALLDTALDDSGELSFKSASDLKVALQELSL